MFIFQLRKSVNRNKKGDNNTLMTNALFLYKLPSPKCRYIIQTDAEADSTLKSVCFVCTRIFALKTTRLGNWTRQEFGFNLEFKSRRTALISMDYWTENREQNTCSKLTSYLEVLFAVHKLLTSGEKCLY